MFKVIDFFRKCFSKGYIYWRFKQRKMGNKGNTNKDSSQHKVAPEGSIIVLNAPKYY